MALEQLLLGQMSLKMLPGTFVLKTLVRITFFSNKKISDKSPKCQEDTAAVTKHERDNAEPTLNVA